MCLSFICLYNFTNSNLETGGGVSRQGHPLDVVCARELGTRCGIRHVYKVIHIGPSVWVLCLRSLPRPVHRGRAIKLGREGARSGDSSRSIEVSLLQLSCICNRVAIARRLSQFETSRLKMRRRTWHGSCIGRPIPSDRSVGPSMQDPCQALSHAGRPF